MKLFILILFIGSLFGGCQKKDDGAIKSEFIQDFEAVEDLDTNEKKLDFGSCNQCDSIYTSFPKDSASFEMLYGYPDGARYDGHEDIARIFVCLNECYNFQELMLIVQLQSKLEYNADATSHIRHHTSMYFMGHKEEAKKVLDKLSCYDFERFNYFSFDRISKHDKFYDKYCRFLLDLELEESCKVKVLTNYCLLKNIETDKH